MDATGGKGKTGQYFHTANVREGEDGYDTIEWIASQPWSSGRVAMTGSSHGGIVQTAALLTRPPHLRAIWVDVAPTNIFAHQSREGGAMSLQMFGALFLHAYDSQEIRDDPVAREEVVRGWENIVELIDAMPLAADQTPLKHVPNLEKVLLHYSRDGEYNGFFGHKKSVTRNPISTWLLTCLRSTPVAGTIHLLSRPPVSLQQWPPGTGHRRNSSWDPGPTTGCVPVRPVPVTSISVRRLVSETRSTTNADSVGLIAGSKTLITVPSMTHRYRFLSWAVAMENAMPSGV
ncbi:MAG: hypothetical protein Ct9H300mP16_18480 [Pseudomonadota bacterium]|nr:MAG: hypothetical protein Ct9H300mP16_18480 [Pseudomonadota bacterium]